VSKWRPFSFIFNWEKQKKVGGGGDASHVVFCKKFPVEKRNARRCVVMIKQPVILSPKFGVKSLHIFMQSQ
jgi:hypothetical protein